MDMRLIDADTVVTIQVYDDMTEEWDMKKMTIAEAIDKWSDEGCPPTVEAELVRHGHWVESGEDGTLFCSECGRPTYDTHDEFKEFMGTKIIALVYPYYCGYCGAKMDGEKE